MNKKIEELIVLAMNAHYQKGNLEKIIGVLKEIFDASDVKFNPSAIVVGKTDEVLRLPVIINGRVWAYYEIINYKNQLQNSEVNLAMKVLSLMHSNILHLEKQLAIAKMDNDTGVYNKNYFLEYVKNFDNNSVENLGCLFIDINGLRDINNTYGHETGNLMIKQVSEYIQKVFNGNDDAIFRYGGDEFVVFVSNQLLHNTQLRINLLKALLEDMDINIACGFSIDYGNFDIRRLIDLAEKRMSEDKMNFYNNFYASRKNMY